MRLLIESRGGARLLESVTIMACQCPEPRVDGNSRHHDEPLEPVRTTIVDSSMPLRPEAVVPVPPCVSLLPLVPSAAAAAAAVVVAPHAHGAETMSASRDSDLPGVTSRAKGPKKAGASEGGPIVGRTEVDLYSVSRAGQGPFWSGRGQRPRPRPRPRHAMGDCAMPAP